MTPFTVQTTDDILLHGITNAPSSIQIGVLCLHMMPATKESFIPLLDSLESLGVLAWAIDFRGHGESTNNGTLDYQTFQDRDHQNYIIDARTVYIEMKKVVLPTTVIGASIGANIALQLQVEFSMPQSILLSPGLNYRGVETLPSAEEITHDQACLIMTSEELRQTGQPAKKEAETIYTTLKTEKKTIKIYPSTAHGTQILDTDPEALKEVVKFITS
jgi:hypothetical protein